jgi:hypothetical protein
MNRICVCVHKGEYTSVFLDIYICIVLFANKSFEAKTTLQYTSHGKKIRKKST